jgi:hypothetical protein
MRYKKILALMIALALVAACKQQASENVAAPAASAPANASGPEQSQKVAAAKLTAAQLLEKKLTKEMPYSELRKTALAEGWLPLVTPECKENVGGEAPVCDAQPELESCSGDGYCNMQFAHGASQTRLKVGTYADNTKFWEFSSAASDGKAAACPAQKFEDFLKTFAGDKAIQKSFTAALVKVEELVDDEKGYSMRSVYFNQADYKDFNLVYAKDGYHAVFNDEVGPKPIAVEIKPEAADTFFVKFLYGVSEGNSYRFKNQGGCWKLTEDPEAPSP